jgi:uncharacterized membrane protein
MALGLVYSTTLLGNYTVGSDIQGELFTSRNTLANGIDFQGAYSWSIVSVWLAPAISQLFNIDIIWVYKAVLPLFLAGTPVILYYAFKRQFGGMKAYFASLFFIIMPVYSLEIATIGKSMVAEFFYALLILAMVSSWNWKVKYPAMGICAIATILAHYTMGMILIFLLASIILVRLIFFKWEVIKRTNLPGVIIVLIVTLITFYLFYGFTGKGVLNSRVEQIGERYTKTIITAPGKAVEQFNDNQSNSITNPTFKRGHLVMIGLGADFFQQPLEGMAFRLVQYLTQLLILIGAIYIFIKPRKITLEFMSVFMCCFGLLVCCILLDGFSSLLNMSRWYQISSFFLAPCLIMGISAASNLFKWMVK